MNNHLGTSFFGVTDYQQFLRQVQDLINNLQVSGVYTGDNLITFGRNLGFLEDTQLMSALNGQPNVTVAEHSAIWRIANILWAVRHSLNLPGDFVECACYRGTTARIICDAICFQFYPEKKYYLYDLFEHDETMPHHSMPEHGYSLYAQVKARFADYQNVVVTQGRVPDVLMDVAPEKIAFLHLDLNNAEAEIGALEILFDRLVPGGIMILDDYGWLAYRKQKNAEDPWLLKRGYHVMELPTGQGMVIKR